MKISKRIKNRIVKFQKQFEKKKKIKILLSLKINSNIDLINIWKLKSRKIIIYNHNNNLESYEIFGKEVKFDLINWHKDYVSGFEYPVRRFYKIKISKWFDKGIDVKFPWEVSRFYFAIRLAQNYVITRDQKYYYKFKELILDWIDKNPFCYGVNWVCTMEVAIRTINWIVAINIFDDVFQKDEDFKEIISKSLIQHAEYISTFPEIYDNGHTTNHTSADYAGLLFLTLTLKEYHKSGKWLNQAIKGLEDCIRYQTYEDGVNFEASIPYHRLALEMFAYSVLVARKNNIDFSDKYYELLFKMFEYSAAYVDHNGNAPQVGDNDSGRLLIFSEIDEQDHSYLLDLGEHIFSYKFKTQCSKRNSNIIQWLPKINKIEINDLNLKPRKTDKSIAFEKGGAYFLKNKFFSFMLSCFPVGQNGKGGHNHYDMGSFTLSCKGQKIVLDPGTYTYTGNYNMRNIMRKDYSHNRVFFERYLKDKSENIWDFRQNDEHLVHVFSDILLNVMIKNSDGNNFIRKILLKEKELEIIDCADKSFIDIIHLDKKFIELSKGNFELNEISVSINNVYYVNNFSKHSTGYGVLTNCIAIQVNLDKDTQNVIKFRVL